MSRANVEVISNGNAAVTRGDWDAVAENIDALILIRTDAR
jgi:hypothetical protein